MCDACQCQAGTIMLGSLIFYVPALIANRLKGQYNRQLKALVA
jgi:hypothetical protein